MRERDDRHVRLGAELAGEDREEVARKFVHAQVVIGWPESVEAHPTGEALITTAANLIARFCPRIHLLSDSDLAERVLRQLKSIDSSASAAFTVGRLPAEVSATLWLGGGAPPKLPMLVTASADAWVAYISSLGDALPPLTEASNPFGALGAAGLAAAEVFKRLLSPRPGRGLPFERAAYSVFTYRAEPDQGPPLPPRILIPGRPLLAGVGAVGQAFLHALTLVPGLLGELTAVDKEVVDDETNLNRYVLAVERDVTQGTPKTRLATKAFEGRGVRVFPEQRTLEAVLADITVGRLPRPELVVSALDDDPPRYELQLLWPDIVIEGATGGTLLQVFRHAYDEGFACLRCIHTAGRGASVPYERVLSERTGLRPERIAQAFRGDGTTLTEEDVHAAPAEHQGLLTPHVGRDICGLLQELEGFETEPSRRIEPAVSFTSYLAGLFVSSEFVRHVGGLGPGLPGRYQLDPIATLDPGPPWAESRRPDCYCVERAAVIEEYRRTGRERAGKRTGNV